MRDARWFRGRNEFYKKQAYIDRKLIEIENAFVRELEHENNVIVVTIHDYIDESDEALERDPIHSYGTQEVIIDYLRSKGYRVLKLPTLGDEAEKFQISY